MIDLGKRLVSSCEQGPSRDDRSAERPAPLRHLGGRVTMNDHSPDQDIICPEDRFVLEGSNVEVHELQIPGSRQHRRHGQKPKGRRTGLSGDEGDGVAETPERAGGAGRNEQDIHGPSLLATSRPRDIQGSMRSPTTVLAYLTLVGRNTLLRGPGADRPPEVSQRVIRFVIRFLSVNRRHRTQIDSNGLTLLPM